MTTIAKAMYDRQCSGNGVADGQSSICYVPDMIKYYLNEEVILPNVPTYGLEDVDARQHVFDNIGNMVIKRTNHPVVMDGDGK